MVEEMALWGVPFGILGGRLYFDLTTRPRSRRTGGARWRYGTAAWASGRCGAGHRGLHLAAAPGGRQRHRDDGRARALPAGGLRDRGSATTSTRSCSAARPRCPGGWRSPRSSVRPATPVHDFHPTFLYELIWDLLLAGVLVWLGRRGRSPRAAVRAVCRRLLGFRMFEESLRVDYSQHFLGLRLNFYIASVMTLAALVWFVLLQRRHQRAPAAPRPRHRRRAAREPARSGAVGRGRACLRRDPVRRAGARRVGVRRDPDRRGEQQGGRRRRPGVTEVTLAQARAA
ncbi:hypothetical protein GXW82_08665 [Streptacidiphilus sp. 4-A2]|nr:hypothetical protein [Streptacidiphilus sp. 4-A2]